MKKLDRYEFIWKAIQKHGYKYDYRKVDYKGSFIKVCIICQIHGEFWITPSHHLQGSGCQKCGFENSSYKHRLTTYEFKTIFHKKFGNKYDTSLVNYINANTKICMICNKHGEFWIKPNDLLNGHGCKKCFDERRGYNKLSKEIFKDRSEKIHQFKNGEPKYLYDEVNYKDTSTKVKIFCKKCNKYFYQIPSSHLSGKGCPICRNKSKLEEKIRKLLTHKNYNFSEQQCFYWLKYKQKLSLDFYIPSLKVAIECQGIQHFKSVKHFGGNKGFYATIERDKIKKYLCDKHNITLLYFTDQKQIKEYELGKLYYDENELLKEILKYNDNNR